MNQRKVRRYSLFIEARLESRGNRINGVAVNLSAKGVGICCLTPIQIGSEAVITLYFHDKREGLLSESVQGKIKWTETFGTLSAAGIEFSRDLNEEDHFLILSHIEILKEFENQ
jgi:hypothetical protein